jgi:hypothetical protein
MLQISALRKFAMYSESPHTRQFLEDMENQRHKSLREVRESRPNVARKKVINERAKLHSDLQQRYLSMARRQWAPDSRRHMHELPWVKDSIK